MASDSVDCIRLGGAIGCLTETAGLVTTMQEMLESLGGSPAVLINIEGSSDQGTIDQAVEYVFHEPSVRTAWFCLHGNSLQCEIVASGLLKVLQRLRRQVPCVVSLQGANTETARSLLISGPMTLMLEPDIERAARLALAASKTCIPRRPADQPG